MVQPIRATLSLDVMGGAMQGAMNRNQSRLKDMYIQARNVIVTGQRVAVLARGAMGGAGGGGSVPMLSGPSGTGGGRGINNPIARLLGGILKHMAKVAIILGILMVILKPLIPVIAALATILQLLAYTVLVPLSNLLMSILMPVLERLMAFLDNSGVFNLFENIEIPGLDIALDTFFDTVQQVIDSINRMIQPFIELFSAMDNLQNAVVTFKEWVVTMLATTLIGPVGGAIAALSSIFNNGADTWSNAITNFFNTGASMINGLVDLFMGALGAIQGIASIGSGAGFFNTLFGGGMSSFFNSLFGNDVFISGGKMMRFNPEDEFMASKNGFAGVGGGSVNNVNISVNALDASSINSQLASKLAQAVSRELMRTTTSRRTYNFSN